MQRRLQASIPSGRVRVAFLKLGRTWQLIQLFLCICTECHHQCSIKRNFCSLTHGCSTPSTIVFFHGKAASEPLHPSVQAIRQSPGWCSPLPKDAEDCRFAHPTAEVAVSGVCQHQKAVWHPAKTHAPPRCGQPREQLRCRIVRLGDLRERKKRPHLVENQTLKSLKEPFK